MAIGRLSLSWAHKGDALISDGDGGYEWVDPDDPRTREVRLLDPVNSVGETTGTPGDNLLIRGNGLHAMRALLSSPEYADEYRGKVKLVYIDPPFNTGQAFEHYDDGVEHSVWLSMLRQHLEAIRDLLTPDGSVWVHLDDAEGAYAKVVMDEVFGRQNHVSTVIWEKSDSPRNSARFLSVDQDYIYVFAKDSEKWRPNKIARSASVDAKYKNPDDDPNGRWFGDNLRANKPYSLGRYEVTGPTGRTFSPPSGKYWRISEEKFREYESEGRIWWGAKNDAFPTMKRYLTEVGDMVPRTLWRHADVGSNRTSNSEMKALFPDQESFSTPKPERLLARVLDVASNPGDIVLDCFAGSGTTAAVAQKKERRWVTMELRNSTVDRYVAPRLRAVVDGRDTGGVSTVKSLEAESELPEGVTPEDARAFRSVLKRFTDHAGRGAVDAAAVAALRGMAAVREVSTPLWSGGGGFRELRVAPPVFEQRELGSMSFTTIADGVDDVRLARSVAAQIGYTSDNEAGPFVGRRGRSRLAVVRGVFDMPLAESLLAALDDGETLFVAATTIEEDARAHVRTVVKGSRVITIPGGLFMKGGAR